MNETAKISPAEILPDTYEEFSRQKAQERFRVFALFGAAGYLYTTATGVLLYPGIPSWIQERMVVYRLLVAGLFFFISYRASKVKSGTFRAQLWGLLLITVIFAGYDRTMYLAHGVVVPMVGYLSAVLIGWMIMMPGGAADNAAYLAAVMAGYAIPIFAYWGHPLSGYDVLQANDSAPVLFGLTLAGMELLDRHRRREYSAHRHILAQNEILNRSAHYDSLTGAGNRLYLSERLTEEFQLSERHGYPLSCIMADLDHFKFVNDSLGHAAGDEVLRGIAQAIRPLLRTADVFARYGGEEFAILLPSTDLQGAKVLAERLRVAIEKSVFNTHGHLVHQTISLGVAEMKNSLLGPEMLLEHADQALYRAKTTGRNRVAV